MSRPDFPRPYTPLTAGMISRINSDIAAYDKDPEAHRQRKKIFSKALTLLHIEYGHTTNQNHQILLFFPADIAIELSLTTSCLPRLPPLPLTIKP